MKKLLIIATLALSGCFATTPKNQFAVNDYDMQSLNGNPTVKEMRVFTTKSKKCAFEQSAESAAVLSIALGFVAEQTVKYVSTKLEEKATYLKSDLTLVGVTNLSNPWPDDKAAPADAIMQSEHNLCVLLVAGEFVSASLPDQSNIEIPDGTDIAKDLMDTIYGKGKSGNASAALLKYMHIRAGVLPSQESPFTGLVGKPSLVAEFRVASGKSADKVISNIIPTFLLYPNPLHEWTVNGPERPFRITFAFSGSESTLVMDKYKSGQIYTDKMMKSTMGELLTEANKRAVSLKVTVTEGPDGLQTAQILQDIAAKKDEVTKYAVDKIAELAEDKGKAEAAKP
jgi:hypothetical protein